MFVAIQSIIQMYTYYYCVDGSIWHFKFPKVVQAHTLDEVGFLGKLGQSFQFLQKLVHIWQTRNKK